MVGVECWGKRCVPFLQASHSNECLVLAARATARTTNLLVIIFGAGFSAMLVYALTSELFSKNSPTVLHGQACELIKSSAKVCADYAIMR